MKQLLMVACMVWMTGSFCLANELNPSSFNQHGMVGLNYQVISLGDGGNIDLFGAHYLHEIYTGIYIGPGLQFPLFYGNYGGFMTLDLSLHFIVPLNDVFFLNAGASIGGGGGGSSIDHSRELSGDMGYFSKQTLGVGVDLKNLLIAFNMSHFQFNKSLINNTQFNLFVHKPLAFSTGSPEMHPVDNAPPDKSLGLELMQMHQTRSVGTYTGDIQAIALQFTHFIGEPYYIFFEGDVGIHGMPAYNQALIGGGIRHHLRPNLMIKSQLGMGSGGYSPTEIDTGPGVMMYPKVGLEYFLTPQRSMTLSGGALVPLYGKARLITLGLGLNLHRNAFSTSSMAGLTPFNRPLGLTLFNTHYFNVDFIDSNGLITHDSLNLLSVKLDYGLNQKWFLPIQLSMATSDVMGFPGYGEALTGLTLQPMASSLYRSFFQVLIGANPFGLIFKPQIGLIFRLTESWDIYLEAGQLIPIQALDSSQNLLKITRLQATSIGLGIRSEFSFLEKR
jgi:hypothetical protein